MKRRILLLAGTFVTLFLAFGIYYLVTGNIGLPKTETSTQRSLPDERPASLDIVAPAAGTRRVAATTGKEPVVIEYDNDNRLRRIFRAEKWVRQDDDSFLVTQPNTKLFLKDGQEVEIKGDRGTIFAEELASGVQVSKGTLVGNVQIALKRTGRGYMRILLDEVSFDNDHLQIFSDSRVTVYSQEADIYGRGLSLTWNDDPRELRKLEIVEGQYMAVKNIPEEFAMISGPGGQGIVSAAPDETPPTTTSPTTASASAPATTSAPATASAPADNEPATQATTKPETKPKTKNRYEAKFVGTTRLINVDSGTQTLRNAKTLTLTFDWQNSRRRTGKVASPEPATEIAPLPATGPTTGPAAEATTQAVATSTQPTTRPAEPAEPAQPMIITWEGPLVLRPVGHTPNPSPKRYTIVARGPDVILADAQTTANCREFTFKSPRQIATLAGSADEPARISMGDGQKIVCRTMEFDRARGTARLGGAGRLTQTSRQSSDAVGLSAADDEPARYDEPVDATDAITWAGSVDVVFGENRATDRDGRETNRPFIKEATFHKDVRLRQGESGDYLYCNDDLHVTMGRGVRGQYYPSCAVATGDVRASQGGSDILAKRLEMHFEEEFQADSRDGRSSRRIRPTRLMADDDVVVTDTGDPKKPVTATCDHLESDLRDRSAVLTGSAEKPAQITAGADKLAGEKIHLRQADDDGENISVIVLGRGALDFLTDKDLNGNTLPEPRPVSAAWSKRMEYVGKKEAVFLSGDVVLDRDSGLDVMKCQEMQLWFEKLALAPRPATLADAPAAKDTAPRRLGVRMEQYSRRKLSVVRADESVEVQSNKFDAADHLVQRLTLAGEQLLYLAAEKKMTVYGHGILLAEDYRPPKDSQDAGSDSGVPGGAVDTPWQTQFEWHKFMELTQDEIMEVVMDEQVSMVHRSGAKILLAEKLNIPPMPPLPAGRSSALTCDKMIARFSPPEDSPDDAAADAAILQGPKVGPLQTFAAIGSVNFRDGPWQLLGETLNYYRPEGLADLCGHRQGHAPADATALHEDKATGRSRSWSSPKITCHLDKATGQLVRVEAKKAHGGGR